MPDVILTFSYRNRDGQGSLRRVKATSLSWCHDARYGGRLCLRAFDVDRQDWRSFLLAGVTNALTIEEPPPPSDPAPIDEAPPF